MESTLAAGAAGAAALASASAAASAAAAARSPSPPPSPSPQSGAPAPPASDGRLRQSVCRWCYGGIPLPDLCRHAAAMGLVAVDLLGEKEWSVPREHGLQCSLANGPCTIPEGFNRLSNHDRLVKECERLLPLVKEAGIERMIVFSGNRAGMSDAEGLRNCTTGLKRVTPLAESLGVTLVMELLNSKVDHKDYMCDRTPWGVALVEAVGSDRFRLLYDIYHMQIMEGDVIRTIQDHHRAFDHYHTAGVPGRHELDAAQELQYPAICRAIADTGFKGYLAQEFIPRGDPMTGLRQALQVCTV